MKTNNHHSSLPWIVRRYYPKAVTLSAVVLQHADIISVADNEIVAQGLAPDNADFIVECINQATAIEQQKPLTLRQLEQLIRQKDEVIEQLSVNLE